MRCHYALEFIDQGSLNLIRQHSTLDLKPQAKSMLIIEVDGLKDTVDANVKAVLLAANNCGCIEMQNAKTPQQKQNLWRARKALSPALRSFAPNKINEDVVVPVSQLSKLLQTLKILSDRYDIPIFSFGHAGDGNLHVNLLYDRSDSRQDNSAQQCLEEVFNAVLELNGTLSGEHGIGILKRDYVHREIDSNSLGIMQKIKRQFDPNNILNPGKTLPAIEA